MSATRALWIVAAIFLAFAGPGMSAAGAACPAARPEVQVETVHGEVRELTDVTVADLARIAEDRNAPLRHPILGAYVSSVGIGLRINDSVIDLGENSRCAIPAVIYVRLVLTNRVIYLPQDFADNACLLDLARGHQRKHAQADAALFDEVVPRFADDLRARLATLAVSPARSEAAARSRMTGAARKIVEEQLDSYQKAKADVDKTVDNREEVMRMGEACDRVLKLEQRI